MADGYRAQVAPERTTQALPFANEDSFGGAIGDALMRAGGEAGRQAVQKHRIELERDYTNENIEKSVELEKAAADYTVLWDQAVQNAGSPDAPTTAQLGQWMDERGKALLGNIKNERLRTRFIGEWQSWRAKMEAKSTILDATVHARQTIGKADEAANLIANGLSRGATRAEYDDANRRLAEMWNGMPGAPADAARAKMRAGQQNNAMSYLGGLDGAAAKAELATGAFDGVLTPEQMDRIDRNADVKIRALAVEADRQAREAEQAQANAEDALLLQADDGADADPAALLAAAKRAEADGKADRAYRFRQGAVKVGVNRAYNGARADQIGAAIGVIERDPDWRKSPEKVTARAQLDRLRTKMREAEPNYTTLLNDADPASFAAREVEAKADMQRRGLTVPQPLGPDDLQRFRDQAKSGIAGQVAVADRLAHFSTPYAVAAARQVDPGNRLLMVATTLTSQSRALLLRGEAAGKVNPGAITPMVLDSKFDRSTGGVLKYLGVDYQLGVKQAAEGIADTLMAERGAKVLTNEIWDEALHRALGGTWARNGVRQGGLGEWNGQAMVLPYRMSQEDFDRAFSRFGTLNGAYSSAGPVTADELRKYYRPVAVGGGYYHFVDRAGHALKAKDGSNAALYFSWNGQ